MVSCHEGVDSTKCLMGSLQLYMVIFKHNYMYHIQFSPSYTKGIPNNMQIKLFKI